MCPRKRNVQREVMKEQEKIREKNEKEQVKRKHGQETERPREKNEKTENEHWKSRRGARKDNTGHI